jgi:V/A-type H+/Na+-transporting ATPase subunit E
MEADMGFQAILDAIMAEGTERIQQIEEQTLRQTEELLQKAQLEAEAQRDRLIAMYHTRALREQTLRLQQTNHQCTLMLGSAHEQLVDVALKRVAECLQGVRQDPSYAEILARLVEESLEALRPSLSTDDVPVLQADPADQTLLNALLSDIPVEYTLNCLGGVIARSQDGRIVVINTLEARLEQAIPFLRRQMAHALAQAFE